MHLEKNVSEIDNDTSIYEFVSRNVKRKIKVKYKLFDFGWILRVD